VSFCVYPLTTSMSFSPFCLSLCLFVYVSFCISPLKKSLSFLLILSVSLSVYLCVFLYFSINNVYVFSPHSVCLSVCLSVSFCVSPLTKYLSFLLILSVSLSVCLCVFLCFSINNVPRRLSLARRTEHLFC
jgi:hypothetical protein